MPKTVPSRAIVMLAVLLLLGGAAVPVQGSGGLADLQTIGPGDADRPDQSYTWQILHNTWNLDGTWSFVDPDMDLDPVVHQRPGGEIYLFWASWTGTHYELAYTARPVGGAWGPKVRLEPSHTDQVDRRHPQVATDALGYLHVAWIKAEASGGTAYHAVSVSGPWTPPLPLSSGMNVLRAEITVVGTQVRVTYWSYYEIVTVEVVIYLSSGGSDDIDPVTVQPTEIAHQFLPR